MITSKCLKSFIKLITLFSIFGVITLTVNDEYQSQKTRDKSFYGYSICRQAQITSVANELGLDFEFVVSDKWGYPILKLSATQSKIENFNQLYISKYPDETPTSFYDSYNLASNENYETCTLRNVKHHVADINEKLLPYIPNDAHHVSYDPNGNRAVYCYYIGGKLGGSRCYLIALVDKYLVTEDISDIERANIEATNHLYSLRKEAEEFTSVRSSVRKWTGTPHKRYGFEFMTTTNVFHNRLPFWHEY